MGIAVGSDRGRRPRFHHTRARPRPPELKSWISSNMPQRYHGAWSHFMDGSTGKTMPVFGMFDNGGDLVETSFLMEGLLAARQYFRGNSETEGDLYRQHLRSCGIRVGVGLVSRAGDWRFSLLALVGGVGMADSTSAHRLQRSHDYLFVGDVIADAWSSRGSVLLAGWASQSDRALHGIGRDGPAVWMWGSLRQRPHLLWNQAGCGRWNGRAALFHALLVLRIRSAQFARPLYVQLILRTTGNLAPH